MKSVMYTRVSSKEQEKEGFSIPAQEKLLQDYAHKKQIVVQRQFSDVETAKAAGRAQFGEMVAYMKENRDVKIILVEKTDRLYRNFRDYLTLEELDVEIHLVKENEIISKSSRSHAKFIHGIKVLMAKNYIDNLSEEVVKGMQEKAEQGCWPQKAPLGYVNNKSTRLVDLHPINAGLVKRLFELYATGKYSLAQVRDAIAKEGLCSTTNRKLAKSRIDSILGNPFYYGDMIWAGKRYRGIHQPIISRDLFDRVQGVKRSGSWARTRTRSFPFKGLLRCGKCGCALVGEVKKGKYTYYHCTSARSKCDQPYVREEVLDEIIADTLKAIQITPAMVKDVTSALRNYHSHEIDFRTTEYERLRKRFDELQGRLDRSYIDRLDGVIDEAYWRSISAKWRAEQDEVSTRMEKLKDVNRDYVNLACEILELAQAAHSLYLSRSGQEKRQLLDSVLSNCTLDGLTVTPTYKKPFNYIAEGLDLHIQYPRQDSNLLPSA